MQPLKKGVQLAPSAAKPCASNDNEGRLKRSAAIGELLGGVRVKTTRSFQPVRRNSYYANDERAICAWQPIAAGNKKEAWRIIQARLQAAEAYDRQNKRPGKKNGPLGHVGLEVLRQLYRMVDFKTGRLEPSIETICEELKRSRGAIVAALSRLREHGFVDWIRRAEPTPTNGPGPQIRQITNAYWLSVPPCAQEKIENALGEVPPPDCELDRIASNEAELQTMLSQLSWEEEIIMQTEDPELTRLLLSYGDGVSRKNASSLSSQNPFQS